MLAPRTQQDWTPTVTVDQAGAIAAVARSIETRAEQGAADAALRMGLCPAGLIDSDVLPALTVADAPERYHAPAFDGAALSQPAWTLRAAKISGERRRRAQDRTMKEMRAASGGR